MEKQPTPKKNRGGRPPKPSQFDALQTVLAALRPLTPEQRELVIKTAQMWLGATNTNDPSNKPTEAITA